jgi:hypothetical protein
MSLLPPSSGRWVSRARGIGLRYRNQSAKAETLTGPVRNRVGIGWGPGANTRLHGATTQKTAIFVLTAVRTSNPTWDLRSSRNVAWICSRYYQTSTLALLLVDVLSLCHITIQILVEMLQQNSHGVENQTWYLPNRKLYLFWVYLRTFSMPQVTGV